MLENVKRTPFNANTDIASGARIFYRYSHMESVYMGVYYMTCIRLFMVCVGYARTNNRSSY